MKVGFNRFSFEATPLLWRGVGVRSNKGNIALSKIYNT